MLKTLLITSWTDVIEITLLVTFCYTVLRTLTRLQPALLLPLCGLCSVTFIAYHLPLPTILTALPAIWGIALLFWIQQIKTVRTESQETVHQPTKIVSTDSSDWIENIIRACLQAKSNNRLLTFNINGDEQLVITVRSGTFHSFDIHHQNRLHENIPTVEAIQFIKQATRHQNFKKNQEAV